MYSRDSDTYKSTSTYSVKQTDSSKISEKDDPENSTYADSSPSNNEYESQRAVGGVRSIRDILNADSQSPIKREDIDVDITGDEPSEDQPSPLKFDDQFGEVVDEERDKIQRLNMRHPHSSTAVKDFLNKTVVPSLLAGMKKMVRERPQNPCEFLGRYLIEHCEHDHNRKEEINNTELRIKQEETDYSPRGRQKRRRGSGSSVDNVGDMDVDNDV